MRKATILIMAVTLVLGLAQCKKNTDIVPVQSGTATITLKVNGDDKLSVNPNTGTVGFTKGDVIYAVCKGTYRGMLTHNGSDFTGEINVNGVTTDDYLYFYFLGNKTPSESLTSGSTGTFTVSIWDQTENYPVISVGKSDQTYNDEKKFTSKLLNQCALVKFNVVTSSLYAPTIITGVNDKVVITLAADGIGNFDFSEERGAVKMAGGSGERWAILLPQGATSVGAAYSADLSYRGTHGELPTITENDYLTNGINVNVNTSNEFTVASDGRKVRFSQGNLQYKMDGSGSGEWSFMENQYDIVEREDADLGSINYGYPLSTKTVSLFGFGTSGDYTGHPECYQPWHTTLDSKLYYAYGEYNKNLEDNGGMADWGVKNGSVITNNYGTTSWRTLTGGGDAAKAEWKYLLTKRTASTVCGVANACHMKAKINGVTGLIIFPDVFTWPTSITAPAEGVINNTTNVIWDNAFDYTLSEWTLLEAAGAVFLPAAGHRDDANVDNVGLNGYYWSSTFNGDDNAHFMYFNNGYVHPTYPSYRHVGRSVRLVSVLY